MPPIIRQDYERLFYAAYSQAFRNLCDMLQEGNASADMEAVAEELEEFAKGIQRAIAEEN